MSASYGNDPFATPVRAVLGELRSFSRRGKDESSPKTSFWGICGDLRGAPTSPPATAQSLCGQRRKPANDILGEKLAGAVLKLSEDNAKAISKGLFRYAVQLEMVMRVLTELSEYTPEQVEEMRRTRGKVKLEDALAGYYDD